MKFSVSDTAADVLFGIFRLLLPLLVKFYKTDSIKEVLEGFPNTKVSARECLNLDCYKFTQFVVCPDCDALYGQDESWRKGPREERI